MKNPSIQLEAARKLRLPFLSLEIFPNIVIIKREVILALLLVWCLSVFAGHVHAFSLRNVDTGVFRFSLELRAKDEVDFTNLDLIFLESPGFEEIALLDDLVITNAGQVFIATEADEKFAEASLLLTNGLPDRIKIMITQFPNSRSSIQGTEPVLLYGDFTGDSGIDFAGKSVRIIALEISSVVFESGSDAAQNLFTDIMLEGWIRIILDPIAVEMFADAYGSINSGIHFSIFSDADDDGDVDGVDIQQLAERLSAPIARLAAAFGSTVSALNYSIFDDADRDGDVDGADLAMMMEK